MASPCVPSEAFFLATFSPRPSIPSQFLTRPSSDHRHPSSPCLFARPWPLLDRSSASFQAHSHHSYPHQPPLDAPFTKPDSARIAFEKAAAYKRKKDESGSSVEAIQKPDVSVSLESSFPAPPSVVPPASNTFSSDTHASNLNDDPSKGANSQDLISKAELSKSIQQSEMVAALDEDAGKMRAQEDASSLEVEIITRDGIIRRKVQRPDETFSTTKERKRTGVSASDFVGLGFSEKKSAKNRPGLAVGLEAPPPGALPEVEIITRDGSKTDDGEKGSLYKPKVATWGIFERPADISRAYGGGRTIRPGEQLETDEEKKARESRTRQLLEAYHKKIGLDVDPGIRAECIKALNKGNDLMEKGQTQSALGLFEKVMQQMPYQSELYGSAALQWSVCVDSLNRFQEARAMYEKIASHPNISVRKKAKQLLFGFQAMETLKVSAASKWDTTGYRRYFNAFTDGYNTLYKASIEEKDEGNMMQQTFLYIGFLTFPLILVFSLIVLKGT